MGTRSRIGVMHGDNCKSVYCNWDGYLGYVGRILLEHYDSARANHLVSLGDISSLGQYLQAAEGLEHTFDNPAKDVTTFYGRDRGMEDTEFRVDDTFDKFLERADASGAEFYYIMKDGVWYVGTTYGSHTALGGRLVPLAEALADQDIKDAEIVSAE